MKSHFIKKIFVLMLILTFVLISSSSAYAAKPISLGYTWFGYENESPTVTDLYELEGHDYDDPNIQDCLWDSIIGDYTCLEEEMVSKVNFKRGIAKFLCNDSEGNTVIDIKIVFDMDESLFYSTGDKKWGIASLNGTAHVFGTYKTFTLDEYPEHCTVGVNYGGYYEDD